MSDQEKLKEKLSSFFEGKLSSLHTKFTKDIEEIEKLKYEFVDDCIKNLDKELKEREEKIIEEEHDKKHEKHHSDIKEKKHNENKEKKNEKEHKEDHKEEHKVEHKVEKEFVKKHPNKRISVDETRSKTPLKELKQKNRILKLDKSADRIPVKNKDKEKNKNNDKEKEKEKDIILPPINNINNINNGNNLSIQSPLSFTRNKSEHSTRNNFHIRKNNLSINK